MTWASSVCAQATPPGGPGGAGAAPQPTPPAPPPANDVLTRAREAWERGDYDVAEPLYRESIEQGGLSPADVLEAYVHLGSTRAVLGKKNSAFAAFKAAALLDAHFVVPPEAGKRVALLAERARRAEARIGGIALSVQAPNTIEPGDSAQVDVSLDPAHAAVALKVAVLARDPMTGKSYEQTDDSAASLHFKLPTSLALPSATLVVRIDALDGYRNRLASVEQRVRVNGAPAPQPIAILPSALVHPSSKATSKDGSKDARKKGGFWSTAWPYVIGGAALAAGGAAVYLFARPSDDVNVGAVRVQLTH